MGRGHGQTHSRGWCCADTAGMAGAKWLYFRAQQAPVLWAMISSQPRDPVVTALFVSIAAANFRHDRPLPAYFNIALQSPAASHSHALRWLQNGLT